MKLHRCLPSGKLCATPWITYSSAALLGNAPLAVVGCSRVLCRLPTWPVRQRCRFHPRLRPSKVSSRKQYDHRRSIVTAVGFDTKEGRTDEVREEWIRPPNEPTSGERGALSERQVLFNRIAPVYDSLNDWLSLGLHRVWKRMCVAWSGAKAGDTVLDICCGSGDLTFLLAEKVGLEGRVSGLDFAAEQLSIAANRQEDSMQTCSECIQWIQGDALALPFEDGAFDAITMGYGLRNVASIPLALAEIRRVLKPAQKASILDFNRSLDPLTNGVQSWMLDNVVVPVASVLGVREEYAYLKVSIARFPPGFEQERLAKDAGFSKAEHYELGGGLMGILVVTK